MALDQRATVRSLVTELNRMVLFLAIAVLAAATAAFFIVGITLHQVLWQELLLGTISNIIASVLIYIALYFSLSRVADLRQRAWQEEILEAITKSTDRPAIAPAADDAPASPTNTYMARTHVRPDQRDIVQRFLEATHLMVVALTKNHDLRMHCHVADEQKRLLYPVCIVSTHINDDYGAAIPYEGPGSRSFVIAKAMHEQRIVAEDLPPEHWADYPDELKPRILATIKCVIAVPIETYLPTGGKTMPIGTISIDCSSATSQELGIVDAKGNVVDEMNDILKTCSRVVHRVLTA